LSMSLKESETAALNEMQFVTIQFAITALITAPCSTDTVSIYIALVIDDVYGTPMGNFIKSNQPSPWPRR
jgi:hypothetical protein